MPRQFDLISPVQIKGPAFVFQFKGLFIQFDLIGLGVKIFPKISDPLKDISRPSRSSKSLPSP
ncbi:MAG TPA: hypothetical protein PLQ45_10970, partial [Anaerohalosphaeraceae bacterium]|nr:hypothetical protein [Anaerohalosphaeraceae bacterium]